MAEGNVNVEYTGRVKWFNKTGGFGFVTVVGGERDGTDVFVHHTNVTVSEQQFRYLVQGEYVTFTFGTVEGDSHEFQAVNVRGVAGGALMCETQREVRAARVQRAQERGDAPRGGRGRGARGRGGRGRGGRGARNGTRVPQTQTVETTQTTEVDETA